MVDKERVFDTFCVRRSAFGAPKPPPDENYVLENSELIVQKLRVMIYSSDGIKSSFSVIRPTFLPPRTQRLPKGLPEESA